MDSLIEQLRQRLVHQQPGPIPATPELQRALADGWDDLAGDDGGMTGTKLLGRTENVVWLPPKLVFRIERHGATVMGSSRAELQEWIIDLEQRTKTVQTVGRRQVRPMQGRLDLQPVAEEIAAAILGGRPDDRLNWVGEDHVRLLIGEVLPAGSTVKETLAGRRKRLREAVAILIAPAGWRMVKANVFEREGHECSASR
jgi:hypothetical protein